MASSIVIIGAGLGGMSAAYELREVLGKAHRVTVVGEGDRFSFTPSNPWVAVGWRQPEAVTLPAGECLAKKGIDFRSDGVVRIDAEANRVQTGDGSWLDYDYLLVCTGPKLAFDEVPGSGPDGGFTQSVCTTPHARRAWEPTRRSCRRPARSLSARWPARAASGRPTNSR